MFQYTCLNQISDAGLTQFDQNYQRVDDVKDADAILVRSAKMKEMEIPDKVLAVARAGAGVNNIPTAEYAKRGIVVFNTPGANANGVKELVLAGMLLASRDIVGGMEWIRKHENEPEEVSKQVEKKKKQFAGCEISGKKLGIIGLGAIGQLVANAATHLGMDVYGYDPYISVDAAWNLSRTIHHVQDVNDIYRQCDYITIHVPLLDSTRGMVNRDAIAQMKEGVVLINCARDLLVDEKAVVEALNAGHMKKYVTDFANPTVVGVEGTLITPHLGASTQESEDNCARNAVKELRDYLENGNIKHSVNFPTCDMGKCTASGRIAIIHKNISGMISKFTRLFGDAGINISDLTNKSKGEFAYTLMDLQDPVGEDLVKAFRDMDGVIRVRVIC